MKTEDKIIAYLDSQMSGEELSLFEKELESSPELKKEFNDYKKFLAEVELIKHVPASTDYFVNMIPKFKENFASKKNFGFIPKLALGLTTISAIVLLLMFTLNRQNNVMIQNFNNTINDSSAADYSYNYSNSSLQEQIGLGNLTPDEDASFDSVITSMLSDELNFSAKNINDITLSNDNTSDVQSMLQGIDNEDANKIYTELLHKRIY